MKIELSKEEAEFLLDVLNKLPLAGTINTLPKALSTVVEIMKKLQEQEKQDG